MQFFYIVCVYIYIYIWNIIPYPSQRTCLARRGSDPAHRGAVRGFSLAHLRSIPDPFGSPILFSLERFAGWFASWFI
jgi:hypothetical protein